MTVKCECPCGATIEIEDSSEMVALHVMTAWQNLHINHRRRKSEYRMWTDAVHRRVFE